LDRDLVYRSSGGVVLRDVRYLKANFSNLEIWTLIKIGFRYGSLRVTSGEQVADKSASAGSRWLVGCYRFRMHYAARIGVARQIVS
jgi:hypothetical protein